MSQTPNRLSTNQIINTVTQQYETQKRSKLPTEIIRLPSGGKVYPKTHPLHAGTIEMRYMTAYDEDILTNTSYIREGVVFDKLLKSIITTNVDINDIINADKDALIIHARRLAYGPIYPVTVTDPKTGNTLTRAVDLNLLVNKTFTLQPDENGEFVYEFNEHVLKYKYTKELVTDITVSELLTRIITEVDGKRDHNDIQNFIKYEFLAMDAKKFRTHVTTNAPGLDLTYTFEGEDGSTFNAVFPIGPDFFWF